MHTWKVRVSGRRAEAGSDITGAQGSAVIIGVLGHSPVIDALARAGKIDVGNIAGRWEAFRQVVVEKPFAFFEDDPQNMVLADEMGIVIGTTHHEPMMRAHDEWHRHTQSGVTGGQWDYATNAQNLRTFWRGGLERMMSKGSGRAYESVVSIGMRGDGDEAMGGANAQRVLETVVADQRRIIAEVTGKPAERTPQVWALYKEVQDYYDRGLQVPDDVILLFSDDNWGQIRRLPRPGQQRDGGFGVYYHFDYVGGPRNYKWLNTNQIEKTWQQMDLAYARGARALWMVNVGDIKPMEFPLSFWMDMAWNPQAMTVEALAAYPESWARENFGASLAKPIARLIATYSRFAARRKPELIDADAFPLDEFGVMVAEWRALEQTAFWNDPAVQEMPAVHRAKVPEASRASADPPLAVIEAPRFSRAQGGKGLTWKIIPALGAVTAFPQGQPSTTTDDNIRVDYDVTIPREGDVTLLLHLVPTLDTDGTGAIRIGISIDDSPVQTLSSRLIPTAGGARSQEQSDWVKAVCENVHVLQATLPRVSTGSHTVKIWRLDDNAVLQKLVLATSLSPGQLRP